MVRLRSNADMPVVTPRRASIEMVKAVPRGEEFSCTIGRRRSCSALAWVRLRQIRPRP